MRYTMKEKLVIAKDHRVNDLTLQELADKYDFDLTNIKYILQLYEQHGEKVFLSEKIKIYSREYKLKAVLRYINGNESYRKIAAELGLRDPGILRDWIKKYRAEGEAGIQESHSRPSYLMPIDRRLVKDNKELTNRLTYLEAENEYLKKSYSLILKRSKRLKKKHKSFGN